MKEIKIGIIGAGSISRFHALGYNKCKDAKIYAVADINYENAKEFAKEFGIDESRVFKDSKEMLKLEELDAVSVCTWNDSHSTCAIDAMRAGKDVLCEKPLAISYEEAKKMQEVQKETGRLLMVGFVRRFASNTNAVKERVESGSLGHIHYAKLSYVRRWGNPGGWFSNKSKSGGGPVIDLGVHVLDLAWYLTGKPKLESVYAVTFDEVGIMEGIKGITKYKSRDYSDYNDVEDGATAMLKFDNGMTVLLETAWTRHIKEDKSSLELFGSDAGLTLDPIYEVYKRDGDYLTNVKPLLDVEGVDMDEIFTGEIRHFIDCIQGKCECIAPVEDGVAVMEMLENIYKSAKTGHEVIIK